MKKLLVTILTLAILLSVAPSLGTVADAATPDAPFYGLTWDPAEMETFGNVGQAYTIQVKNIGGNIVLGSGDNAALAKTVKAKLDKMPEGARYIRLFKTGVALELGAKHVIYVGEGITQLRTQFEAFIEAYYALGGKMDGVILDTEYVDMGNWYIYGSGYGGVYEKDIHNHNFYNEVVAHPRYATEIRPMLEEYGFVFYEKVGGDKSEIWSIYPYQYLSGSKYPTYDKDYAKYASCASIWNRVMYDRQAMYFNYALYEPLAARYPDANMSDYQSYEGNTWSENLYTYSNGMKTGNVSNTNDYSHLPKSSYFKDGDTYLYQNPVSYNNAVYDDDPYGMLLWNINKMKNIYASTSTKKISVWISRYDYSSRAGSYAGNTAYYNESLYHYGMLNPQPFLIYMTVSEGGGQAGYDLRLKYMSEAFSELTRVAGYSDRKVIDVPVNWNDGYLLSGLYAGGRNIWRITPDTTSGTSLAAFKISDSDPTFKINGTTIRFPGGKIIKDTSVTLGSCGYWVETAKDVKPVVTRDTNRYAENPSYVENYESYAAGTALTKDNVALPQTWEIFADKSLVVTEQSGNKALALIGSASLKNVKLPKNITAGDSYAKRQAWEITVTLPKAMSGGRVTLLNSGLDGGFKLENGKVYYDENGTYQEMEGVSLAAGKAYTLKREMNLISYTCTYSVYADGKLLKQAAGVKIKRIDVPVTEIMISCTNLTEKVLVDDYKLYPVGVAQSLTVYDANGGEKLESTEKNAKSQVAYRLSWMNATTEAKDVRVKAAFYNSDNELVSETVVATVKMAAGDDGVITGIVQNQGAKVTIYLEDAAGAPVTEPTEAPTVEATKKPTSSTTAPTKGNQSSGGISKAPIMLGSTPTKATAATTPGATQTPGQTQAPGETQAPEATVAPDVTQAPGATQAPEETVAPGSTEHVDESKSTESTTSDKKEDKDEDKKKDKGGTGTIVLVVGIVVALAAAGTAVYFLVIKKKD